MKVVVADKTLSTDQLELIRSRAQRIKNSPEVQPRAGSLNEHFSDRITGEISVDELYLSLLSERAVVDTAPFDYPRKPGLIGGVMFRVRGFLWKLLRYQHDRMSSRQNRINCLIVSSIEQQRKASQDEIADLKREVSELRVQKSENQINE